MLAGCVEAAGVNRAGIAVVAVVVAQAAVVSRQRSVVAASAEAGIESAGIAVVTVEVRRTAGGADTLAVVRALLIGSTASARAAATIIAAHLAPAVGNTAGTAVLVAEVAILALFAQTVAANSGGGNARSVLAHKAICAEAAVASARVRTALLACAGA